MRIIAPEVLSPMNSVIEEIIDGFDKSIMAKLDDALNLRVTNFRRDLFPILRDIDQTIPGAGFQYVIWVGHVPKYPFPG